MDCSTLEKLHYELLKEMVKEYCASGLGRKRIDELKPSTNMAVVSQRLDETTQARVLLDASYHIPFDGISNIHPFIEKMDKGASLNPEELIGMSDFLRGCRKVKLFMESKEGYAPTLCSYSQNITDLSEVEEEINDCIKGNQVDSGASKELKRIRRHIELCEEKIKERLERFLKSSGNKEYIQEFFISQRNGKYTIPIKANFKNHVEGTIVDTSPKGGTVFIEPKSISKHTGELAILKVEESVEEYRILATLTQLLYEEQRALQMNMEVVSKYDMIWAKARYSHAISGIKPKLNEHGYIKVVGGRYPLLEQGVPLDFEIGGHYRTLVITGPNAGGKTIVLKTLGMFILAVQSGFHIQAHDTSELSIFQNIFVDIGDNQSVENALSTFSSHVKNLAYIMKHSNHSTLLLFDEIGSGTEPNEGAALAISMLEEFYHKGCITVATTHYGEIKDYSANHPDFENAAMEFKKDTLEPLYRLQIGKSGDSNALYISEKMGLSGDVVKRAKRYMDEKSYDYRLIQNDKIKKEKVVVEIQEQGEDFEIGDRVLWLDKQEPVIVYEGRDSSNCVTIFFEKEMVKVPQKRLRLEAKASQLYPENYDFNQLFISFQERKWQHDIERGSKKALRKLKKEQADPLL